MEWLQHKGNLLEDGAVRGKMDLQLFSTFSCCVWVNRAVIEKQFAEFALIVLGLFRLHALYQLKLELGRPHTSIMMMGQLVSHQSRCMKPGAT